jgi:hypothetical protein
MTFLNTRCWNCGAEHDAIKNVHNDELIVPSDGDLSFCMECGELSIFDVQFPDRIRKPSPKENDEIAADNDIARLKLAWVATKKGRIKP